MSVYNFASMPAVPSDSVDFATWENGFTNEEIQRIDDFASKMLPLDKAVIAGKKKEDDFKEIRKSSTSWISLGEETSWLYDRLAYIVRQLNAQNWRFDLDGFVEDFQFTVYSEPEDHYTWHVDTMKKSSGSATRKLSLVMQLSDPYEYEGGELQLKTGHSDITIPKQKGLVTVFPSFTLHRVTPLLSGTRKTLVVWVAGPPFK